MAGPDRIVRRGDGIVQARIEAARANPLEMTLSIKLVTTEWTHPVTGETHTSVFPVIEAEGFEKNDRYRFATPGTSWNDEDIIAEGTLASVDLTEVDIDDVEQ